MPNIQNIASLSGHNVGGSTIIYFIPINYVLAIPKAIVGEVQTDISLNAGKKWFYWRTVQFTLGGDVSGKRFTNGTVHPHKVEGFIPGDIPAITNMMSGMTEMRYLALRHDANGQFKLLGSMNEPLEFEFKHNFPKDFGGQKGYSFKFHQQCLVPEFKYLGLLETEDGQVETAPQAPAANCLLLENNSPLIPN